MRLESAAAELAEQRARMRGRAAVAGCTAVACVPLAAVAPRVALVLAVAAFCELLLAAHSLGRRRALVRTLALDPAAYVLPEVRDHGARLVSPRRRARLARSLLRLRRDAARRQTLLLRDRIEAEWPALEALGRAFASPDCDVEPPSAAACEHLLTSGLQSPLLNPELPPDELAVRLHHIRAGVHAADGRAAAVSPRRPRRTRPHSRRRRSPDRAPSSP